MGEGVGRTVLVGLFGPFEQVGMVATLSHLHEHVAKRLFFHFSFFIFHFSF